MKILKTRPVARIMILTICGVVYLIFAVHFLDQSDSKSDVNGDPAFQLPRMSEDIMMFRQNRYDKYQNIGPQDAPGENGAAVVLNDEEQKQAEALFKKEAFNIIASDKISLQRTLRDIRSQECKLLKYPEALPSASVVIIFHNEAWSALLRTVHSVVNRSPPSYLHEVILLDDFSNRPELGESLIKYVLDTWPDGIVKYVRTKKRSGLIRARMAGAEAATGDVLIFLDSHCETSKGWLEPLLARINEKRTAVLCPMIDSISDQSLSYDGVGGEAVGGFTWSLHFTWRGLSPREAALQKSHTNSIRSPTMAGGLFAADRKYFFELGGYDPGMDVWGGENLEISFRTWMCGGSLEFVPCSRVGHIFRSSHPYTFPGNKDTHGLNSKRLAEVWMDGYKRLFYKHRRELVNQDAGNFSDRIALRKRLKCKSFKWYLDNIYPEKFIPDDHVQSYGMVRNPATNLCLDTMGKDEKVSIDIVLYPCQNGASASEIFSLSMTNEIRREETCMDVIGKDNETVRMLNCHGYKGNQEWKHDRKKMLIMHGPSGKCLDSLPGREKEVVVNSCNGDDTQKWTFEHYL